MDYAHITIMDSFFGNYLDLYLQQSYYDAQQTLVYLQLQIVDRMGHAVINYQNKIITSMYSCVASKVPAYRPDSNSYQPCSAV